MKWVKAWFCFLEANWLGITLTLTLLPVLSGLAGFWIMGLKSGRYEIMALWPAVAAVTAAATAAWGKWFVISKYNTPPNEPAKMGENNCEGH